MNGEVDVFKRVFLSRRVFEGHVVELYYVLLALVNVKRLSVGKLEQLGIFEEFAHGADIEGLSVKSCKSAENTADPSGESAYCREIQKELRYAEPAVHYHFNKVEVSHAVTQECQHEVCYASPNYDV